MAGNVFEWVSGDRLLRGGSWFNASRNARTAIRGDDFPDYRNYLIGFRVLLFLRQD